MKGGRSEKINDRFNHTDSISSQYRGVHDRNAISPD